MSLGRPTEVSVAQESGSDSVAVEFGPVTHTAELYLITNPPIHHEPHQQVATGRGPGGQGPADRVGAAARAGPLPRGEMAAGGGASWNWRLSVWERYHSIEALRGY